jgi:hypothetical protein
MEKWNLIKLAQRNERLFSSNEYCNIQAAANTWKACLEKIATNFLSTVNLVRKQI